MSGRNYGRRFLRPVDFRFEPCRGPRCAIHSVDLKLPKQNILATFLGQRRSKAEKHVNKWSIMVFGDRKRRQTAILVRCVFFVCFVCRFRILQKWAPKRHPGKQTFFGVIGVSWRLGSKICVCLTLITAKVQIIYICSA